MGITRFLLRRLVMMAPALLGIAIVSFLLIHLAPGEPVPGTAGKQSALTGEDIQRFRAQWDLDKPLAVQLRRWVGKVLAGDFGRSLVDGRPALGKILERLPATLELGVTSMVLMFLLGVPLGVFAAARERSATDQGIALIAFVLLSLPSFFLAILLQTVVGLRLGLPIEGASTYGSESWGFLAMARDRAAHMCLPVLTYALGGIALVSRFTRAGLLEVLRQDYVRTARAKGLPPATVLGRHALANALIPIVTLVGAQLPTIVGGSFIVETIFSWPGMGRLGYEAIMARDYNVICAQTVIVGVLTLAGNLAADLGYMLVDPRIARS